MYDVLLKTVYANQQTNCEATKISNKQDQPAASDGPMNNCLGKRDYNYINQKKGYPKQLYKWNFAELV